AGYHRFFKNHIRRPGERQGRSLSRVPCETNGDKLLLFAPPSVTDGKGLPPDANELGWDSAKI
ncbi:MAG: hypothetical protein O3B74_04695, partial [Proteobacteria bacterium]|nr:hypothetical protein [Pseudomonadota bacterium]